MQFDWSDSAAGETLSLIMEETGHTYKSLAAALGMERRSGARHLRRMAEGKEQIFPETRVKLEAIYEEHQNG